MINLVVDISLITWTAYTTVVYPNQFVLSADLYTELADGDPDPPGPTPAPPTDPSPGPTDPTPTPSEPIPGPEPPAPTPKPRPSTAAAYRHNMKSEMFNSADMLRINSNWVDHSLAWGGKHYSIAHAGQHIDHHGFTRARSYKPLLVSDPPVTTTTLSWVTGEYP
jgi:hypothetical protein